MILRQLHLPSFFPPNTIVIFLFLGVLFALFIITFQPLILAKFLFLTTPLILKFISSQILMLLIISFILLIILIVLPHSIAQFTFRVLPIFNQHFHMTQFKVNSH